MKPIGIILPIVAALSIAISAGCKPSKSAGTTRETLSAAAFAADSAYGYVAAQVAFGPRVPGTEAHDRCARWLAEELRRHGADTVMTQQADITAWDGSVLPMCNVIARYNPDTPRRILLLAHWDTRPWADQDPDPQKHTVPIDGANDGASGVGVLLEVARQLGLERPEIGVDILLADLEDYGRSSSDDSDDSETWALGTQYFADHLPYSAVDMPEMAVLLDMVGGRNAAFHREYFSHNYAPQATARIWSLADALGMGERFPRTTGGAVTDDHVFLLRRGIPAVDIIENQHPVTGSFNPTWHTVADNLDNIDAATLGAVGSLVTTLIRQYK